MTYSDFLNQFVGVISSFVSWLSMIANVLIHNYFFITLFGLVLFVSLFWLIYYLFYDFIYDIIHKYDEYNDLYANYELKKQVQSDYLDAHYNDEYDYLYRKKLLSLQVMNGLYQTHKDLIVDNKINNLDCNIDALKKLKQSKLVDNDDSNDNDVDMIVPNPPVHLSNFDELKRSQLQSLHNELVNDNNSEIDRILSENDYLYKNNHLKIVNGYLVDEDTGEIINDINSLDSDNLRHIGDKTINIHTSEIISNEISPIPAGDNELSKMSSEELSEIKKFNDKNFIFPNSNKNFKYGELNEDLDSQLFSSNSHALSDESELSTKPISNEGKYNFLKNNPQFLSDDWVVSDKGIAINKETGEVIEM